jgi:hypothetical protein
LLKTEHHGNFATSGMHYPAGVHNETAVGENGEDYGDDEDSMHEDTGMRPDEEASSPDMDDDDDDDDDEPEADLSGVDAESIGDIVLDVHNIRVKFKVIILCCNCDPLHLPLKDLVLNSELSQKDDTYRKKEQFKKCDSKMIGSNHHPRYTYKTRKCITRYSVLRALLIRILVLF